MKWKKQVQQFVWYTVSLCVHLDLGKRGSSPSPHSSCSSLHGKKIEGAKGLYSLVVCIPLPIIPCWTSPKLASRIHAGLSQVHPEDRLHPCTQRVAVLWGVWVKLGYADWSVHIHAYQEPSGKLKLEVKGDRPRGFGKEQTHLVNSYLFRHSKYVRVGLHLYFCSRHQMTLKRWMFAIIEAVFTPPCTPPLTGLATRLKHTVEGI